MIFARAGAIALAVVATGLTLSLAAPADPPSPVPDATVDVATPLTLRPLRPSKPLELAQEHPHSGLGWKLVAIFAALGGAAFYVRRRWPAKRTEDAQLTIVRRASIGMRSELLIVNVEGQRLLLGVTPQSIQSLAVLDVEEGTVATAAPAKPGSSFSERFGVMLDAIDGETARDDGSPRARREEAPLPGQARGLLSLRRRP